MVSCDHGKSLRAGQPGFENAFNSCCGIDTFYLIMPFANDGDFSGIHLNDDNFLDIIKLFKGPIEGLKFLHDIDLMHRDVTRRNMLIMADGCGVLGGLGKTRADSGESNTSTAHSRAPEVDGTSVYGKSADVWSFGFAIMETLFKDLHTWDTFNKDIPQSKAWVNEAFRKLMRFAVQSSLHSDVAMLVSGMLSYKPENRPTMATALHCWSNLHSTAPRHPENLENSGPSTKFQKTSENTKVARSAPS